MGWAAAGAGTLVAAYFVYRFSSKYLESSDRKGVEISSERNSEGIDHTRPGPVLLNAEAVDGSKSSPLIDRPSPPALELSTPQLAEPTTFSSPSPSMALPVLAMPPPPPPPPLFAVRSTSPPRLKPPSMAAPPRPSNGSVRPPPSVAASLRVPQTKILSNTHMQPASSTLGVAKKSSKQVMLKPGYSPLDWAALTTNPKSNLRGKDVGTENFIRVTPSMLKSQTGRKGKDAWTVYQGKVYNITPYLQFHPGGEAEIMKGAGRDSAKLFMEVHPWVNWDGMLSECLVGVLVAEDDERANRLDEMD